MAEETKEQAKAKRAAEKKAAKEKSKKEARAKITSEPAYKAMHRSREKHKNMRRGAESSLIAIKKKGGVTEENVVEVVRLILDRMGVPSE